MGIKTKRNIILMITLFAILLSTLSPVMTTFADLSEATREFEAQSSEFLKDADEAKDIIKILQEDAKENPKPNRNTISFVMKRLLYPGVYVNDVRDGIISTSIGKKKEDILHNNKYVCHPNSPNNLIDHNCNIPNFTTGIVQNVVDPFMVPLNNAEKSSSYSVFGLGVPDNIPGGIVPINPASRTNTYTALELYGYNLQLTSYNGEWDHIIVSNSSRMLSNFGVIDRITLVGTTLWNGVKSGVGSFIENFSFNPLRWYGNIARAYESGVSSGINTVVDTSELNVVATNAWKRPRFDGTLYNIYVMTDAEVIRETARNYFGVFNSELNSRADASPILNEVLALNPDSALNDVTAFSYDPNWETDESIAAREAAEAKRASEEAHNASERFLEASYAKYTDETYTANIISPLTKIPEPIYYTESEQLGFWEEDPAVAAILGRANNNGLIAGSASSYETYEAMMTDWQTNYTPYFQRNFDALGETVTEILEENDASVFMNHPHLDPKQGISRYACANSDGSIMRKSDGTVEYLYNHNNDKTKSFPNTKCSQARPPIGGGLMGNGWDSPEISDTRHISNVSDDSTGLANQTSNILVSFIRSINSFVAKITNVILDLSFSPILERLGIDTIIAKLVEGFRDTVFFPLTGLVAAIGALLLFFQVLRNGSIWQLFTSLGLTLIIFIAGAAFLLHPSATIKLVDEVPSKIDSIIANAILIEDDGSSYCSTGGNADGIRSAQCNVWGAMVFEPWVHLQFGTGFDNLYSKGNAPSGGSEMKNKNESLVGDAAVNMGGGTVVHNWALYQLEKTKSGTINAKAHKDFLGVVDKDMYRLVDLQAGPNYGANSDTRYFETWSGKDNGGALVLLTLVQAIMMSIAIGGLGIAKIETSFLFSISILFLPFMLLYALLPKGKQKLQGYLANLISLLLKRVLITVMLAVLLKVITLSYSKAESLETGAMIGIFVSLAFIIYRKELLELMSANTIGKGIIGNDSEQLKNAVMESIPEGVKQYYNLTKANVKGATAGFVGGSIGAAEQKIEIRRERSKIRKRLDELNKLDEMSDNEKLELEFLQERDDGIKHALANQKKLTEAKLEELMKESDDINKRILKNEAEIQELINEDEKGNKKRIETLYLLNEEYKERQEEINTMAAGGVRDSSSLLAQGVKGSIHSKSIIGRTAERRIRSKGLAPLTAYQDVKNTVYMEGADKITNIEEDVEYDVYKEILSNTENSINLNTKLYGKEKGELQKSPEIQRQVRKLAKERKDIREQGDYKALTRNREELQKAADIVDRRRLVEKAKLAVTRPTKFAELHNEDLETRKKTVTEPAKTDLIKKEIEKGLEEKGAVTIDDEGKTVVRDRYIQKQKDEQDNLLNQQENYQKELSEIEERKRKSKEMFDKKVKQEREDIDDLMNEEDEE